MNNMLELPKESDYHKTSIIEARDTHQLLKKSETILYKKGIINLRNIVDVVEQTALVNVIDEEKYPQYEADMKKLELQIEEQRKEFLSRNPAYQTSPTEEFSADGPVIAQPMYHHTQPPFKSISVTGTLVLYFNGVQRFCVDDFQEFSEMYFLYLQKQKLDM